jgi:hypothetical protein
MTVSVQSHCPVPSLRTWLAAALVGLAALCGALPAAAHAEMVELQYKPPAAPAPAPNDLTPIAPTDAAWNPPLFTQPGSLDGNTIPRPGDAGASTTDYVEYARTAPEGTDDRGVLRGTMFVDFDTVNPALPAIVVIHGGLVQGKKCAPYRRVTQWIWARKFTAAGYIVFTVDFPMPSNDKQAGFLGAQLNKGNRGDCAADDGWEPGAKRAQIAIQLAVRSLKEQLRLFAAAHPGNAASPAFAAASKKVVAFGGSSGGHLAARLALRSEDVSSDPTDGPQNRLARRVAGAVGIGTIGECTTHNPVRTMSKFYGFPAFLPGLEKPFAKCGPVVADPLDSPIQFYGSAIVTRNFFGKPERQWSPLSGSGAWGKNIGWDSAVDNRWAKRTCEDLNPGSCTFEVYPVPGTQAHFVFPLATGPPGAADGPTYWDTTIFPKVDKFFRSVKADS